MTDKTSNRADLAQRPSRRSRRATVAASMGMLVGATTLLTSCVTDPDCGVCDPDRLVLEIMSADNYANDQIFLLSPECEGDKCPKPKKKGKYFVNQVLPCIEEEAAENDDRPPEEYCKISPLVTLGGLEFVFNNLLDPTTIELVRKQPDDPSLLEVYNWKSRIARIEGPITRFNGDYIRGGGENPDVMTRAVNLSCIENLSDAGELNMTYAEALAADPFLCQQVNWGGDNRPNKMRQLEADGSAPLTKPRVGQTTWKGFECSTPDEGPDTCCSVCDYELSVNVAKYGVSTPWDEPINPDPGGIFELQAQFNESKVRATDAIPCVSDGTGNKFAECRDFTPGVFRADQEASFSSYTYEWNGEVSQHKLPRYDKLRETHPDDRPAGIEQMDIFCDVDADCPSGAECIGEDSSGNACEGDTDCTNKRCRQEWFVECVADPNTTGDQGFCVDSRFKDAGAGACYVVDTDVTVNTSQGEFTARGGRDKLSLCDTNENNFLNASECCLPELGYSGPTGEDAACDPLFSQNVTPVDRFERDQTLPNEARDCFCGELSEQRDPDICREQIEKFCTAPYGDGPVPEGAYITQFVSRFGGVIYDPALKGVNILPADLGNYRRARVEACAETVQPQPQIGQRSILDGWRAGDSGRTVETNEDFDRAMCSGSEYKVVFETGEGEQRIEDKPGNTLAGKDTYVFQTPEFRVVPNSGFPTDNIRIGGCDRFELSFSNKFDLEPSNLNKIQIWEVERNTNEAAGCPGAMEFTSDPRCWSNKRRVAGGEGCTPDDKAGVDAGDEIPCLTVDVSAQFAGTVNVQIDSVLFGRQLFPEGENGSTGRYRMIVPGLNQYNDRMEIVTEYSSLDDLATLNNEDERNAIYRNAFHDACGMPLVTAGMEADTPPDYLYDFSIDSPKCIEDEDLDGVQLSCDNAPDHTNRSQTDDDADGFGNVVDRCVLTATATNTDDTDRDGLGSACDNCRRAPSFYNVNDGMAVQMVQALLVRNNPNQTDSDQDGIGDACDNCPSVPNCESFGNGPGLTPYTLNTPIQDDNTNVCQTDNDQDMVGDTCAGTMPGANAAGPIGTGVSDDFDQDGIENSADLCPRNPVTFRACTMDTDCPEGSRCEGTVCNHVDSDNDGVGNICDNCPGEANMGQVVFGQQADDDPDGDFVGTVCETNSACFDVIDPRPYSFYDVSADGLCCTLTYPGDGYYMPDDESDTGFVCMSPPSIDAPPGTPDQPNGIMCDPDGLPIQRDCMNEPEPDQDRIPDGTLCRRLPERVANRPGVLTLPPGCEAALMDAGITAEENVQLSLDDAADEVELWGKLCFLPQFDQDFDGVGDACDLCTFSYDPGNEPFISETTGQVFPTAGRFCNGVYDIENSPKCTQTEEDPGMSGTGTGTGGGTGTSG